MDQLRPVVRRRRRAGSEGFTLLEVMIALSILGVGLLAMLAMQLHAMQAGRAGKHTSQAATYAKEQIELLNRLSWTDPSLADTGGWTVPVVEQAQVTEGGVAYVEQAYNVSWRITDVTVDLKAIDVQVQWNEPDRPNRQYAISTVRHNDP